MEFKEVLTARYSCKKYSDRPVEKEKLEAILNAGRLAPTAKNLQEQRVYVVQNPELLAKIDAVTPCRYGASTVLVVAFDANNVFTYPGGKRDSGVEDATIVATHMILAAADEGVDSCWINFLDPQKLNDGVTLFVDGVDTRDVLGLLKGFKGEASGRMYGKIPLQLKNGEKIRLRNAYLHSAPGEEGTLKVYDPAPVVENLALGGVPEATCANVAKALANLTYTVLRISLQPEDDGGLALAVKLAGSATHNGVTVPVSFEVTFHGDIEQLINTGLKTARMKK